MKKFVAILCAGWAASISAFSFSDRFSTSRRPAQPAPFGMSQTESLLILEAQTRNPDLKPELVYWQRPGSPKRFYLRDQAQIWDMFQRGTTLENIATRMGARIEDISELIKVLIQKMQPRRSF